MVSGPVFMYCAPVTVSGGTEGAKSDFPVLRSQTHFRRYRGRRSLFSYLALPKSFLAVPRAPGPIFMFCAPRLFFDSTEGVESRFHVLRSCNCFGRNRGRRVQFLCFTHLNSFLTVKRALGPVFKFRVPGLIFDGTEGVGPRFQVLRFRIRFGQYKGRRVPFSCIALSDPF
jgi:hypothetical protein